MSKYDSIDFKVKGTLESTLEKLKLDLGAHGYEVNAERSNYRVIMFRKATTKWTQGHVDGKEENIRFSGPEALAVAGQHLPGAPGIREVRAFRTTDDRVFETAQEASKHQEVLNMNDARKQLADCVHAGLQVFTAGGAGPLTKYTLGLNDFLDLVIDRRDRIVEILDGI